MTGTGESIGQTTKFAKLGESGRCDGTTWEGGKCICNSYTEFSYPVLCTGFEGSVAAAASHLFEFADAKGEYEVDDDYDDDEDEDVEEVVV